MARQVSRPAQCFNPLSLCRERLSTYSCLKTSIVSIHSPYAGRDRSSGRCVRMWSKFQSTLPMQGETRFASIVSCVNGGFNPLSLCRERPDTNLETRLTTQFQSTLPMQGETTMYLRLEKDGKVSIHSPYAGRDLFMERCGRGRSRFNPLSLCRERLQVLQPPQAGDGFNPLSLCRERRAHRWILRKRRGVSIHSPYAGRDQVDNLESNVRNAFQSTLPMQGETMRPDMQNWHIYVSIHSPYAGRDSPAAAVSTYRLLFQSTLPMQGETRRAPVDKAGRVSIHSPYAGRDSMYSPMADMGILRFNPLSLCRERPRSSRRRSRQTAVSIHSPYAGRDETTFLFV